MLKRGTFSKKWDKSFLLATLTIDAIVLNTVDYGDHHPNTRPEENSDFILVIIILVASPLKWPLMPFVRLSY